MTPKLKLAFENGVDVRLCEECGKRSYHEAKRVQIFKATGMTFQWVWSCEMHPLPDLLVIEAEEKK